MRLDGQSESDNIEDQRGSGGGRGPMMIGGGLGSIVLIVLVMLLGGDPRQLLNPGGPPANPGGVQQQRDATPAEREARRLVGVVLKDTEQVWGKLFRERGMQYREPKLVLFTGRVNSACGLADSAVGPFYCPGDQKVYLDLVFFQEMKRRFKAPGDFAQAYVVAHEIGHHVQKLLGTSDKVDQMRGRLSKQEFNQLSVRLELQADFYAGVWAHHAQEMRQILEPGDIDEALGAANAIGDDTLQKQARGTVVPDAFTHGTSAQRVRWFKRGFQTGRMEDGDTFSIPYDRL